MDLLLTQTQWLDGGMVLEFVTKPKLLVLVVIQRANSCINQSPSCVHIGTCCTLLESQEHTWFFRKMLTKLLGWRAKIKQNVHGHLLNRFLSVFAVCARACERVSE